MAAHAIAAVGGVSILIFMTFPSDSILLYGLLILIAKFGISAAFNIVYCSNAEMFPALFTVTAFGISNFFARSCTFFAP